jgi:hypothetical protein
MTEPPEPSIGLHKAGVGSVQEPVRCQGIVGKLGFKALPMQIFELTERKKGWDHDQKVKFPQAFNAAETLGQMERQFSLG